MEKILVSACLLGENCRYDGLSKPDHSVIKLSENYELIPICPEVLGGLPTPRMPSEVQGDSVVRRDGVDVTRAYQKGAEAALAIAKRNGCRIAVLKERSPSCGKGRIHNGHFDGGLILGDGVTVRLLEENGIRVIGESDAQILYENRTVD